MSGSEFILLLVIAMFLELARRRGCRNPKIIFASELALVVAAVCFLVLQFVLRSEQFVMFILGPTIKECVSLPSTVGSTTVCNFTPLGLELFRTYASMVSYLIISITFIVGFLVSYIKARSVHLGIFMILACALTIPYTFGAFSGVIMPAPGEFHELTYYILMGIATLVAIIGLIVGIILVAKTDKVLLRKPKLII
jgi:hypothetical protein